MLPRPTLDFPRRFTALCLQDAANWFETVQQADALHKKRFERALKNMP